MLIESVAFFLAVSLLFYALFAGADFGAGILESFVGSHRRAEQKKIIDKAIGPVWEANHVWLILAVVILFVGFPKAYSALSVTFHVPLTIMLLGIILRGCAFTFRHYDAKVDYTRKYYTLIFIVSSYLTPIMLGNVAGAMLLGRTAPLEDGFLAAFIHPWFNYFSFSVGIFTCVLFAFLAAIYLIGETSDPEIQKLFIRKAKIINAVAIITGGLVFIAAEISGLALKLAFFMHPVSLVSMLLATVLLLPLWLLIFYRYFKSARLIVAMQVGFILIGWFGLQFPTIMNTFHGAYTIYNIAAPKPTLEFLLYALIGGSAVIFPSLIYLFKIFKSSTQD